MCGRDVLPFAAFHFRVGRDYRAAMVFISFAIGKRDDWCGGHSLK